MIFWPDCVALIIMIILQMSNLELMSDSCQLRRNGRTFPTIVNASNHVNWNSREKTDLLDILNKNGAVVFRNLGLQTAEEFNDFSMSFGLKPFGEGKGTRSPRDHVVDNVYTANNVVVEQSIPIHQDLSHQELFPTVLFFYCHKEPTTGGESPLALSDVVYQKIKEREPEFVRLLEKEKVRYTSKLPATTDLNCSLGSSWQDMFQTSDKAEAEKKTVALGNDYKWLPNDTFMIISKPKPVTRVHKITGQPTWFNQIQGICHVIKMDPKSPHNIILGNGEELPEKPLAVLEEIIHKETTDVDCRQGDVLLVDNVQAMHGKRAGTGPRKILVSFFW